MTKTYIPTVVVEPQVPWCSVWLDQIVKQRLATEISMLGSYGLVEVMMICWKCTKFSFNMYTMVFSGLMYSLFLYLLMS